MKLKAKQKQEESPLEVWPQVEKLNWRVQLWYNTKGDDPWKNREA